MRTQAHAQLLQLLRTLDDSNGSYVNLHVGSSLGRNYDVLVTTNLYPTLLHIPLDTPVAGRALIAMIEAFIGADTPRPSRGHQNPTAQVLDPSTWIINALHTPMRYALWASPKKRVVILAAPDIRVRAVTFQPTSDVDPVRISVITPPMLYVAIWSTYLRGFSTVTLPNGVPANVGDPMTVAPWCWGNVDDGGRTCMGEATFPSFGTDGISHVIETFWAMPFNQDLLASPFRFSTTTLGREGERHTLTTWARDFPSEPLSHRTTEQTLATIITRIMQSPWGIRAPASQP